VSRLPSVSDKATSETKTTLSITGFSKSFVPTIDQFFYIFKRCIRPIMDNGDPIPVRLPESATEVFEEYLTYTTPSTGETEVVVKLKTNIYNGLLPIARSIEDTEAEFLEQSRFSWSGVLLPILDKKILMLSAAATSRLKMKKQWTKIQWYPLYFRTFQPDVVQIENATEENVASALTDAFPSVVMSRVEERDEEKDGILEETGMGAGGNNEKRKAYERRGSLRVNLQLEATEDVFQIRSLLAARGFMCRPVRSSQYDFIRAFRESKYNDSFISSAVAGTPAIENESVLSSQKKGEDMEIQSTLLNECVYASYDRVEGVETPVTQSEQVLEMTLVASPEQGTVAADMGEEESPIEEYEALSEEEESFNMELLTAKPPVAGELFPDLEDEEERIPQAFSFSSRREKQRRFIESQFAFVEDRDVRERARSSS
jgi:hypothetical protein